MLPEKISALYGILIEEWKKKERDLDLLEDLLRRLKAETVSVSYLPIKEEEQSDVQFLLLHREVFEMSAMLAALKKDLQAFQRALAQLKHYYMEVRKLDHLIGESTMKYHMLGLYLMFLLSQNRIAEFHIEVERIDPDIVSQNIYIIFPVKLEQCLMLGTYNKIFIAKANAPSQYFDYFIDLLLITVRNEIALSIEKSYQELTPEEAARLLFFMEGDAMKSFQRFAKAKNWKLNDKGKYVFSSSAYEKDERLFDVRKLMGQHIYYAKQLEMII